MQRAAISREWTSRLWRLFWLMVLVGHAMVALAWWWVQPGGFSVGHSRFWSNRAAPAGVLTLALAGLVALHREKIEALRLLLPPLPAAWAAAGLASRIVFPTTLVRLWLLCEAAAAVMGLAAIPVWRRSSQKASFASLAAALASSSIGAAIVWTQRVPTPATHPLNFVVPEREIVAKNQLREPGTIRLSKDVSVQTFDGTLTIRQSRLTVTLEPLLTFLSRSPDGCPTVFVGRRESEGPQPRLAAASRDGTQSCSLLYLLRGQGPATLEVRVNRDDGNVAVEASTRLDHPVFSHLNSFCDFEVRGHSRLSLGFSPCPDVRIDVRPSDYPIGRPARFGFLNGEGTFQVAEAASGEKGPFAILASGPLTREQTLSITLYDQDEPVGRISLADWASQSDTTLSPTAGWGVPANAIEFSLSGDSPASPASIFVTLAGTSVGRGWDCVGHVAGTYRNRIQFENIQSLKPPR